MAKNSPTSQQVLADGGIFHTSLADYMPRQSQQEMAIAVEQAIQNHGRLVVESGTGTGKTYAYLVPIVLGGKRSIISTATRHLQEQIFHRDLPVVLGALGRQVRAVLLKGRANYLCRYYHRQNRDQIADQINLLGEQYESSMAIIDRWAMTTDVGDIAEVPEIAETSPLWQKVTSTADNCLGGKCPDFQRCCVNQARKRALEAELIVVNHHLFFSDLTMKSDGLGELLPPHEVVVLDEAHSIGAIASRFFGGMVSSYQIKDLLTDIQVAEKHECSGVDLATAIDAIAERLEVFQQYCVKQVESSTLLEELICDAFETHFTELISALAQLQESLEIAAPAGDGLQRGLARCSQLQSFLDEWRENRDANTVSWLAAGPRHVHYHLTPLNVGSHFGDYLQQPEMSWIFTSATLAVAGDFTAFCRQLGVLDADTAVWQSPFDYKNNTRLYLPPALPEPRESGFARALADTIIAVTTASRGRAFCLFTSYAMMDRVYAMLQDDFAWPLLKQGTAAKPHLLKQFAEQANTVLFGTASFWEGVDVKGAALSCVIIDKLPFVPPTEPVLKCRLQQCAEQGGNPFMEIQVPDAVIALKQGVGRLIRSETDKGVLVICDRRLTDKPYGRVFLQSLPPMPVSHSFQTVVDFFQSG